MEIKCPDCKSFRKVKVGPEIVTFSGGVKLEPPFKTTRYQCSNCGRTYISPWLPFNSHRPQHGPHIPKSNDKESYPF